MDMLPGCRLLVTLTYVGPNGDVRERRQFLGEVLSPAPDGPPGLYVRSPAGEVVALPVDTAAVLPAPRGQYRCLVSGETVTDPDLLTSWRIAVDEAGAEQWQANYAPHARPSLPDEWEFTYRHDAAHLRRFVESHASRYLGKRLRVSLALYEEAGSAERFLGEEQRLGRIVRASFGEGVIIVLENGKEFRLPPDLSLLQPAPPADQAHADLVARWTVIRAAESEAE
jgi:hypothetical protein